VCEDRGGGGRGFRVERKGIIDANMHRIISASARREKDSQKALPGVSGEEAKKLGDSQPIYISTKVLWPHCKSAAWGITPEWVLNPEPPDSRPCV
jgi:hypothetical protein